MTKLEAEDERIDDESSDWVGGEAVLEADLPASFQETISEFLGTEVTTLGEWVAALRDQLGGGIDVEHLCHADGETPHRAVLNGETFHFQCFYDAVALSLLEEESVDIRTESPDGDVVEASVTDDGIQTTPESAVTSFGVTSAPQDPGGRSLYPAGLRRHLSVREGVPRPHVLRRLGGRRRRGDGGAAACGRDADCRRAGRGGGFPGVTRWCPGCHRLTGVRAQADSMHRDLPIDQDRMPRTDGIAQRR